MKTNSPELVPERERLLVEAYRQLWERCEHLEAERNAALATAQAAQDALREFGESLRAFRERETLLEAEIAKLGESVERIELRAMLAEVAATLEAE